MAINLTPPSRRTGTADEKINGLYSYLYQLVEALNVTLNKEVDTQKQLIKTGGKTSGTSSSSAIDTSGNTYQQLKALIVKTAVEVTGSMRKVVAEISEGYKAQDEYGTFEEYLSSKISAGADGFLFEWDAANRITTTIADYNEYLAESGVYLRMGIVKHNDDGTIESGIIVGKNFHRVTVDGKISYESDDVYALFTADMISFWQSGVCFAKLSLTGLVADQAYVDELIASGITAGNITANMAQLNKLITSVIESEGGDASIALDDGLVSAIAKKIDLSSNESIQLAVNSATAAGVVTGTGVTITKEQVIITIPSEDGEEGEEELSVDKDGVRAQTVTAGEIYSDSVVRAIRQTEYKPANGGELSSLIDDLNACSLIGDTTIDASAVSGGIFRLHGIRGGQLNINGGTFNSIDIVNCQTIIVITGAHVNSINAVNSRVLINGTEFEAQTGVTALGSSILMEDCTGICTTLVSAHGNSLIRIGGQSLPYGLFECDNSEIYSSLEFTAAPSEPETNEITTISMPARLTRTWADGWLSTSSIGTALYQGRYGENALRRGCMWFDTEAITGRHIISATLTLKRVSGVGGGGAVSVGIYGTSAAAASGTPAIGTKYASISLANGGKGSVDVTEAAQALADGSIAGLMIYDSRTGTFSGKSYTYGYCKVYGTGEADSPTLNITYE